MGGGPTFGKNSQIISFFFLESVPYECEFNIYSVYGCVCMNTIHTHLYMSACECMSLCECVLMCLGFDPLLCLALSFPSHPSQYLCSCPILCALPSNEANTSTTLMLITIYKHCVEFDMKPREMGSLKCMR